MILLMTIGGRHDSYLTKLQTKMSRKPLLDIHAAVLRIKAGDGTRTHDIMLGKHAFYH